MFEERVYKVDQYFTLVAGTLILGLVPVTDFIELITTGTYDFSAVSRGRIKFPSWIASAIIWPIFIFFLTFIVLPALRYILRGFIFKLHDNAIQIGDDVIEASSIHSYGTTWVRGLAIRTDYKTHYFMPGLNSKGQAAALNFLSATDFK